MSKSINVPSLALSHLSSFRNVHEERALQEHMDVAHLARQLAAEKAPVRARCLRRCEEETETIS